MSQTAITLAFEQHLADLQMGGQPVIPDEFVLANIPELDLATPIDRAAGLPSAGQIVHRQLVDQRGKVNANGVAYSIIMDTRIGDFTFNAIYLLHKASSLVAMVVHKAPEDKLKNKGSDQPGNSLVKSMIMEYQGAAVATNTTIDASTWQIDFSARLFGLDRDIQQQAHDHYGDAAFIGDGLLVRAGTGVNEFIVTAGLGYVAGLRADLKQPHSMVVASRPAIVYADVYHAGTLLSDWSTILTITASTAPLVDYIDQSGYQHYVTPLAQLAANGAVTDLRGRGGLWWHEQRAQAHTPAQVGLDKVKNWDWSHSYTDATGGAGKYATGKAVADAYNALNSSKLNAASYTAADVLAKLKTVDGASSGLDADLLDGQHGDYYRDWVNLIGKPATMPPSSHAHPWAQIVDPPAQATRWPKFSEVVEKPTHYPTIWDEIEGKASASELEQGVVKVATEDQVFDGADDSVVVTPKKMKLGFSLLLASTGYIVFPFWLGGLIIQWGNTGIIPNEKTKTVYFPIAFSVGCWSIQGTKNNPSSAGTLDNFMDVVSRSNGAFVAFNSGVSSTVGAADYDYLAIGK